LELYKTRLINDCTAPGVLMVYYYSTTHLENESLIYVLISHIRLEVLGLQEP